MEVEAVAFSVGESLRDEWGVSENCNVSVVVWLFDGDFDDDADFSEVMVTVVDNVTLGKRDVLLVYFKLLVLAVGLRVTVGFNVQVDDTEADKESLLETNDEGEVEVLLESVSGVDKDGVRLRCIVLDVEGGNESLPEMEADDEMDVLLEDVNECDTSIVNVFHDKETVALVSDRSSVVVGVRGLVRLIVMEREGLSLAEGAASDTLRVEEGVPIDWLPSALYDALLLSVVVRDPTSSDNDGDEV